MRALRTVYALAATAMLLSACGVESQTFVDVPPAVTRPTLVPPPLPTTTFTPQDTTTTVAETTTTPAPPVDVVLPKPVTAPRDTRGAEVRSDLGTIEIPKIGLRMTMLEGIRLTTLDQGPGHWPGSAMPGQIGNVVVAGHRTSHSKPFRHLDALSPGDEVIFTMPNGRFVYSVVSTEIVSPDRVDIVDQTSARTATLFACHPPGSTKQRIVVHLIYSG
jgi:sortase A